MRAVRPVLFGLVLACALPAYAAPGCAGPAFALEVDMQSFSSAGYAIDVARAEALKAATAADLDAAFAKLCAAKVVKPDLFAGHDRLLIQNGDGATEPLFYIEEEGDPPVFIYQFAFQEGPPPKALLVERAIRCFANPESGDCGED